ncbi:abortive infection family protein [Paeniroseomonas aquatica]
MGERAVSELTRRAVLDVLDTCELSDRIDLVEFISGMWPVERMSSPYDGDLCSFADAMVRHTRRNDDWTNGDLLRHLGLLGCSQRRFFGLLEAALHPRTRGEEEQRWLADTINGPLRRDGFALLPTGRLSGYPIYSVQEVTPSHASGAPADADISAVLGAFDEAGVQAAWMKALERRDRDPEGAITMARTLLEKVCKHIIEEASGSYGENDDLPKLYRAAAEKLNLAPSQHTEETFKVILGNCQAVVQGIGTIRNKLGDSHGTGRKPARPQPRHAALAVNLAGTMAAFLVATWAARQAEKAA